MQSSISIAMLLVILGTCPAWADSQLRVGAAAIDVTPQKYPVLINGGMTSNSADSATTPIHARAVAFEHGQEKAAIVVVDSCMMSRALLDHVKGLASKSTGIATDRMLISATHAHSVPASMGCLGTNADETYIPYLTIKVVEAIERAHANLEPAKVGWAVADAAHYTAVRQWIRRPDRLAEDPFGNLTVRANMHAGRNWDDVTGEAGPEDPDLSLISFQAIDGRPIAVLANFSMHYFSGEKPVAADYFGKFSEGLKERLAGNKPSAKNSPPFVGIMSHGCSGDIWRMDYTKQTPSRFDTIKIDEYSQEMIDIAMSALKNVEYNDRADLAMAETRLHLKYRVPDKQRLEWAQRLAEKIGDRLPKTTDEIYALEQIYLAKAQETDVVVQALRIGQVAIATTPTETYALTGLKLKWRSPLKQTMVIELANGGDGYIPPPEQHPLGGYNTWAARSAGLEMEAEPKIAEAALSLLEKVCKQPRRSAKQPQGTEVEKIIASRPAAYYRMDEMEGPRAVDSSGANLDGIYEPGVLFFLEGPEKQMFSDGRHPNRATQMAGGRMRARIPGLSDQYSVSLWIWNGMPTDARATTGWIFGRGPNHSPIQAGDALGIAGQGEHAGQLMFQSGDQPPLFGKTDIPRWTWAHVTFERRGENVRVTLDKIVGAADAPSTEIEAGQPMDVPQDFEELFFGGRGNPDSSWEGRVDEIVVRKLAK